MKNFKNIYLLAGALALCSVGFVSCDDDDEYDFPGTDRTLVYAKGSTANYSVLVSPILTSSGVDFSTYATVNKRAAGDIRVTYVIRSLTLTMMKMAQTISLYPMNSF